MKNINNRDKIAIICLVLFFILLGIEEKVISPIFGKWKLYQQEIKKEQEQLKKIRKKIAERSSWEADKERLGDAVLNIKENIHFFTAKMTVADMVKTITDTAVNAGIQINQLRPVTRIKEDDLTVITDTFDVEGLCDYKDLIAFMGMIRGFSIPDLNLSKTDDKSLPMKFYMKIEAPLSDETETIINEFKEKGRAVSFDAIDNPFIPKEPEATRDVIPEQSTSPPHEIKEVKPSFDLSDLRLKGTFTGKNKIIAVIFQNSLQKDLFVSAGDKIMDLTVQKITKDQILLSNGDESKWLEFLNSKQSQFDNKLISSASSGEDTLKKPARLGIHIKELTFDIAKEKKINITQGLLVTKERSDLSGLNVDDVIIAIQGIPVSSFKEAENILKAINAGDMIKIDVLGKTGKKALKVKTLE